MKLMIKRLTNSDLTFFESQFRKRPQQRQKSINLDARVFVTVLYPDLASDGTGRIPVEVEILGPGIHGPLHVARKIVRSTGSKNWRLNGEFVSDPDGAKGRFADLEAGDVAILSFGGEVRPTEVRLHLISQAHPADAALFQQLVALLDGHSSAAIGENQLAQVIEAANPDDEHPIAEHEATVDVQEELAEALHGAAAGTEKLIRRKVRRTHAQLQAARARASEVGQIGERLVHGWLAAQHADVRWVAAENAVMPWDLESDDAAGTTRWEVKSTAGPWHTTLYLSAAELRAATESDGPYRLVRVSDLDEAGGMLRVSDDLPGLAAQLHASLALPAGLRPTEFALDPSVLSWVEVGRVAQTEE